jgi:hypothetical protein
MIASGLPQDAPANALREDPVRPGLLFAATESAVWASADDGDHWNSLQLNLPHTSMRDLAVHDGDLIVATHGRSFWILDDIGPLRQDVAHLAHTEALLLKPATAVRVRRSTGTDTPIPPDEAAGRNPPTGAVIDYYLAHPSAGPLTLEVRDLDGNLVRRISSADPAAETDEERARELIPAYWIRPPTSIGTGAGMHRFVWDLRYAAPRAALRGYPISAVPGDTPRDPLGPLAVPGEYRVRLLVGSRHWDQPLTVAPDPRVNIAAQAYSAQLQTAQRLADALDLSTAALLEARSLRAQLKPLSGSGEPALAARIKSMDERVAALLNPSGGEATNSGVPGRGIERLNGDFATLYEQVTEADAAPSDAQSAAADRALQDWQPLTAAWHRLRQDEVPALNRDLLRARLTALQLDLAPPRDADQADEE